MNTLAHLTAALAALIHLYIYWLERHAYGSARFCHTFNIAERDLPALRAPFHNLALYSSASSSASRCASPTPPRKPRPD